MALNQMFLFILHLKILSRPKGIKNPQFVCFIINVRIRGKLALMVACEKLPMDLSDQYIHIQRLSGVQVIARS